MVCTIALVCRIFERFLLIVGCMHNFGGSSIFCFLACMFVCVRDPYFLSMVSNMVLGYVALLLFVGASSKASCSC